MPSVCTPHTPALQESAATAQRAADERYGNLAQAYGELKTAWDARPPRDEDVAALQELRSRLRAREAQLAGAEEQYHELRNVRASALLDRWVAA